MLSKLLALSFVAAMIGLMPARADELADIEKLFRAGDSARALSLADATIAAKPRAAQVRFLKGVMLSDLHRKAEAIQVFKALTQDFPELPDPYNNLAVLYASEGRLGEALQALQAALRNDPHNALALQNLGDVHLALAIDSWTQAAAATKGGSKALQHKLRAAREVMGAPTPGQSASAPG